MGFIRGTAKLFVRPYNLLFRDRAHRANSQYTSMWGLGRICKKKPWLVSTVAKSLAARIGSGELKLRELIGVAAENVAIRPAALQYIIENPEIHERAIDHISEYLVSDVYAEEHLYLGKEEVPTDSGARAEAPVYEVRAVYTERIWAQKLLLKIFGATRNKVLKKKIEIKLSCALRTEKVIDKKYGPAEYRNKATDHADW